MSDNRAIMFFRSKPVSSSASFSSEAKSSAEKQGNRRHDERKFETQKNFTSSSSSSFDVHRDSTIPDARAETIATQAAQAKEQAESENKQTDSAEMFHDVLRKISSLGSHGRQMLRRLMDEIDAQGVEGDALRRLVNETMNDKRLSNEAKRRRTRDLVLSSPLYRDLTREDGDSDAPLEEVSVSSTPPFYLTSLSCVPYTWLRSKTLKRRREP